MKLVKFENGKIHPVYDLHVNRLELCFVICAISNYLNSGTIVLDTEREVLTELLGSLRVLRDLTEK